MTTPQTIRAESQRTRSMSYQSYPSRPLRASHRARKRVTFLLDDAHAARHFVCTTCRDEFVRRVCPPRIRGGRPYCSAACVPPHALFVEIGVKHLTSSACEIL